MITMHPGLFIQEAYLYQLNISQAKLAEHLEVDKSTVSRFLAGKSDLSAEMAVRLSKVFGCSAEYFMEMQNQFSLQKAKKMLEGFTPTPI